jgi:exocyst complex component 7
VSRILLFFCLVLTKSSQARLVETGAKKLTQLYTKLVAEGSSGSTPPPGSDITKAPFPGTLISNLTPLVAFLRTLPVPSTHPSHPAAPAIMSVLKEAQRGYADMRGNWSRKCLETQGQRVLDRADNIDPVAAGREFGLWVQSVLSVVQVG